MEPRIHNLPAPTNSFVGRDKELSALAALLSRARLITLVGMSGIGKTRLALELARQLVNAPKRRHPFPDGVWFVSLESLSDVSQVIAAIGEVLGVPCQEGVEPIKTLISFCASRRLLLLLDIVEHLVQRGLGDALRQLLSDTPHLSVLVTSQVELHLQGEYAFPVEPLRDAAPLFAARARQRVPDWQLTEENALLVADICRRVDNIPLAIELAAGQLRPLTERQILDGLARSLDALDDSDGDRPPRHRGLKAALAWSWQTLTEEERHALTRLSVLDSGTFFADAVPPITALPNGEAVAISLCRKGLLQAGEALGQVRYRMLESVRRFAAESMGVWECGGMGEEKTPILPHSHTPTQVVERAAIHYLTRMVEETRRLFEREVIEATEWFRVEWANLRQACDWTLQAQRWEWTASFLGMAAQHLYARGDIYNELEEVTVVLYEGVQSGDVPLAALGANPQAQYSPQTLMVGVVDLACQLHYSGRSTEARHLLRQFLSDLQRAPDWETEARVWHQLAWMEHRLRNSTEATKCFERQWQIVRRWGDEKARVKTLLELGVFAREQRRLDDARIHLEEGLRLASQPGLEHIRADLLAHLCAIATEEGRFEEACRLGEDYMAQVRRNGTVLVLCRALQEQAERHLCVNEPDVAESLLRESVNAGRRVGTLGKLAWACLHLCKDILVPRGAYAEALPFQQEALAAARASHNDYITAVVLTDLAHFHLAQGDLAAARRCATDAYSFVQTPRGRKALPDFLVTWGCIYLAQNHWRAAERCLPQSVSLLREQNRSQAFAHALLHCGRLRHAQGKRDEARRCYEESLSLYYREDEQCRVRYHLALLDIEEGNTSQAAATLRALLPICETWQWTLAQEAQKTLSDITHHASPITHHSPLAIQLFGPFTVLRDGQPLSQPLWPRARQVLAYLALHRGKPVSRDALLDLLYPDAPADRASFNRLERLVSRLRNVLGDKGWIRFSNSHYVFDPDGRARCDVEEFDALRKRAAQHRRAKRDDEAIAAWEAADALVRGDLMADIAREWVEVERDDFRERYRDLLLNLADAYARRKAYNDVVRVGQRVLALDPTDEPAHRFLIRAYAASGRRSDVVRQFELCRQILRNQLGVEPSPRTRRLYDNLCQDDA